MLIGITGTDGAGKGAVVDYLVKYHNFTHCSARAIWEKEFEKRKMESNRANMRLVANELRSKYGNDFLVTHYLEKISEGNIKEAIIESIRTTAEAETLKKNGGFLVAVDADQKIRYKRVTGRKSSSDNISFEEFVAHEKLEMNDPDPNGMQKAKVMEMADYTIINNGSFAELENKISKLLSNIKNG